MGKSENWGLYLPIFTHIFFPHHHFSMTTDGQKPVQKPSVARPGRRSGGTFRDEAPPNVRLRACAAPPGNVEKAVESP